LEFTVGFVELFNVTAWRNLVVDVALEALGEGEAVLLDGCTEKSGGGSAEGTSLG
jgi:hypothetical protein